MFEFTNKNNHLTSLSIEWTFKLYTHQTTTIINHSQVTCYFSFRVQCSLHNLSWIEQKPKKIKRNWNFFFNRNVENKAKQRQPPTQLKIDIFVAQNKHLRFIDIAKNQRPWLPLNPTTKKKQIFSHLEGKIKISKLEAALVHVYATVTF